MADLHKRVAILGAGPIGVEAGLYAAQRGFDVQIYERERPGAHMRRWSHVTFFSPWSLNRSAWGEAALAAQGVELDDPQAFPTGAEYLARYLEPLTHHELLEGRIHNNHEVLGVSRVDVLKGDLIGSRNSAGSFLIHVQERDSGAERFEQADIVLDTTGVYQNPAWLGPGGLAALGERALNDRIERYIPNLDGQARTRYAGKRTLLIGGGHSAVTTLKLLDDLRKDTGAGEILWLLRAEDEPYTIIEDDPLPERLALGRFGNAAASGDHEGIVPIRAAMVESLGQTDDAQIEVTLRGGDPEPLLVDEIIANVGYRPDTQLTRELQVHYCYASEGTMKLAASLLAASSDSADCLDQASAGPEVLQNPESNLFVLGHKSYGRNSAFLLKVGFEQIEQVFELL